MYVSLIFCARQMIFLCLTIELDSRRYGFVLGGWEVTLPLPRHSCLLGILPAWWDRSWCLESALWWEIPRGVRFWFYYQDAGLERCSQFTTCNEILPNQVKILSQKAWSKKAKFFWIELLASLINKRNWSSRTYWRNRLSFHRKANTQKLRDRNFQYFNHRLCRTALFGLHFPMIDSLHRRV